MSDNRFHGPVKTLLSCPCGPLLKLMMNQHHKAIRPLSNLEHENLCAPCCCDNGEPLLLAPKYVWSVALSSMQHAALR